MTEITSVTISDGTTTVTLNAVRVEPPKKKNLALAPIFNSTPIVQFVGFSTKEFMIEFKLTGAAKDTDKATLESFRDASTTHTYYDSEHGSIEVFVEEVDIPHIGGTEPVFYRGRMKCVRAD